MTSRDEKQRRMEIRRKVGSRSLPKHVETQQGPDYLVAHACFDCRKSFKKAREREQVFVCPNCGSKLYSMGRSFKAPKKDHLEKWCKVQSLYAYGFRFFSYHSYPDAPKLPERFKDVEAFVAENPQHPFRVEEPNEALLPTAGKQKRPRHDRKLPT